MTVLVKCHLIFPSKFLITATRLQNTYLTMQKNFSMSSANLKDGRKILIVGGGTGGITMAAKILGIGEKNVTVIEPSEMHYYQPYWTLVGGRKKSLASSCRLTSSVMPKGANWMKDKVMGFDPFSNTVHTEKNGKVNIKNF
ncbi:sulfide:quinone oxidoreductase, mitochondrial [Caerostris extrusa]|uniref:Sulfide:quinone oxidoreductase, mitochondrial n=1 Tax=Caerostris extrusa TaxID=172846 RepID=A0AAV4WQL2_CAEEX|nr:sulfide:quinone oxidoreductase, mitochondrial [Caerostris extrusa]